MRAAVNSAFFRHLRERQAQVEDLARVDLAVPHQVDQLRKKAAHRGGAAVQVGLYPWELDKNGRELNVRVQGQIILNGTTPMLDAALAGLGLAYVPEDLAQPYLEQGRLKRALEDWCPPYPGYHLYYPSRRKSSQAFALLVEALRYRS